MIQVTDGLQLHSSGPTMHARLDSTAPTGSRTQKRGMNYASGVAELTPEPATKIAAAGVRNAGAQLPHLDRIQHSFGKHDVTDVQVATGSAAREASAQLGARGYATEGKIALAEQSLHTVAHEAAHVVQQRNGVHLKSAVGASDDAYEAHADAVADAVVRGDSAEDLLSSPPTSASSSRKKAVQLQASTKPKGGLSMVSSIPPRGNIQERSLTGAWATLLQESLTRALFAGYGESTQRAARKALLWVQEASKPGPFKDVRTLRRILVTLLDGLASDAAKKPSLAAIHRYAHGKIQSALSVSLTGRRPSVETVAVLLKQTIDKMASVTGHSAGATDSALASRKSIRALSDQADAAKRLKGDRQSMLRIDALYTMTVGGKTRTAPQTFFVRLTATRAELYQMLPRFRRISSITHGLPKAHLGDDTKRQPVLLRLFGQWVNDRPPLASGTLTLPALGKKMVYTNDTYSRAVLDFFGAGSSYDKLNRFASWAVVGGGLLCIAGFLFPPAAAAGRVMSSLGTFLVNAATMYQLPSLILTPLAQRAGGYRPFSGVDLLNLMGIIAASGGIARYAKGSLKSIKEVLKPSAAPVLATPTAAEATAVQQLTQRRTAAVLRLAVPISDVYGIYLGSSAGYEKLKQLVKEAKAGNWDEAGAVAFQLLGDVICVSSGVKGMKDQTTAAAQAYGRFQVKHVVDTLAPRLHRLDYKKKEIDRAKQLGDALNRRLSDTPTNTWPSPRAAEEAIKAMLAEHSSLKWVSHALKHVTSTTLRRFDATTSAPGGDSVARNRAAGGGLSKRGDASKGPTSSKSAKTGKGSKSSGSLKTNTSASNAATAKPPGALGSSSIQSMVRVRRKRVSERFLSSLDGLLTQFAATQRVLGRIGLSSGVAYALSPMNPAKGAFPVKIATHNYLQGALDTFVQSYNTQVLAASGLLKTRLPTQLFSMKLDTSVSACRQVVAKEIATLTDAQIRTLDGKVLLPYASPLAGFVDALSMIRSSPDAYRDLIVAHGTSTQRREIVYHLAIKPMDFPTAYGGCPGQHHRRRSKPPRKPTSPTDTFPPPPPLLAQGNAALHRLWKHLAASDEDMRKRRLFVPLPGGSSNRDLIKWLRKAK